MKDKDFKSFFNGLLDMYMYMYMHEITMHTCSFIRIWDAHEKRRNYMYISVIRYQRVKKREVYAEFKTCNIRNTKIHKKFRSFLCILC